MCIKRTISELIAGIIGGVVGLLIFIGALFPFIMWLFNYQGAIMQFKGLIGWEAETFVWGLAGFTLGAWAAGALTAKLFKEKYALWSGLGGAVLGGIVDIVIYDYNMSIFVAILMICLPVVGAIVGLHYKEFFKQKKAVIVAKKKSTKKAKKKARVR